MTRYSKEDEGERAARLNQQAAQRGFRMERIRKRMEASEQENVDRFKQRVGTHVSPLSLSVMTKKLSPSNQ